MKREKIVSKEVKVTKYYCDLCEAVDEALQQPIPEGQNSVCDHCGKDLCLVHRKNFTKPLQWQSGFQMHIGPSIMINLCEECRALPMSYEGFLDIFFKDMKLLHSFPGGSGC